MKDIFNRSNTNKYPAVFAMIFNISYKYSISYVVKYEINPGTEINDNAVSIVKNKYFINLLTA